MKNSRGHPLRGISGSRGRKQSAGTCYKGLQNRFNEKSQSPEADHYLVTPAETQRSSSTVARETTEGRVRSSHVVDEGFG